LLYRGTVTDPERENKLDFWDLTVLIFRRWKVAVPLLLLAISVTAFVALTARPDYKMTSYVQLVPARVAPTDDPTSAALRNPWNQLGLNTLGQASIYATQDQKFLDTLKAGKHTDNFTLTMTYPNPIVTVEVVGSTPADARETTQLVIDRLQRTAEALQEGSGAGSADIIATQRLDQGENLLPSRSKVKRAMLAVAAAGLVLTAGGTVGFDAFARRRSRKRAERERAESLPETTTTGADRKEVPSSQKVPVGTAGLGGPASGGPQAGVPEQPEQPAEPPKQLVKAKPSVPVQRTAVVLKPATKVVRRSPAAKSKRPPEAAMYRSMNAQGDGNGGDHDSAPSAMDADSAPAPAPADVCIVLQPKRLRGENGGKSG
jgi:hypothetical protein